MEIEIQNYWKVIDKDNLPENYVMCGCFNKQSKNYLNFGYGKLFLKNLTIKCKLLDNRNISDVTHYFEITPESKFYRYEYHNTAVIDIDGEFTSPKFPNAQILLTEYDLIKETPKGFWIGWKRPSPMKFKWVSKQGKNHYASLSKEQALVDLEKRTSYRKKILEFELATVNRILNEIKNYKIK